MHDGAELIKLRPGENNLWSTYQRAVANFTVRRLSREEDILNAFAGILRMICPEPSLQGIPSPIFDIALLWQPRERLRRRSGFPSWSWAGWIGKVQWFNDRSLESYKELHNSESHQVVAWTRWRCWIVWHASHGMTSYQSAHSVDGPFRIAGLGPSTETHNMRFAGQPSNFIPSKPVLSRQLSDLENQNGPVPYLQFLDNIRILRYQAGLFSCAPLVQHQAREHRERPAALLAA